jgi:hypothetical protein
VTESRFRAERRKNNLHHFQVIETVSLDACTERQELVEILYNIVTSIIHFAAGKKEKNANV